MVVLSWKEDFVQGLPRGIGQGKQRISEKAGDVLQMSIYIFWPRKSEGPWGVEWLSKQQELTHLMQCVHNGYINYDCILSYRRHSILLTPWCHISLGSRVEEHLMGALRRTEDQPGNHGHSRHGIEPFGSVAERAGNPLGSNKYEAIQFEVPRFKRKKWSWVWDMICLWVDDMDWEFQSLGPNTKRAYVQTNSTGIWMPQMHAIPFREYNPFTQRNAGWQMHADSRQMKADLYHTSFHAKEWSHAVKGKIKLFFLSF